MSLQRAPSMQDAKAFVVEDDNDVRWLVRRTLEQAGLVVEEAGSAEDLFNALDAGSRPDVIILDLTLPGNSGWTVLNSVRSDPQLSKTEVIILTGRDDDQFRDAAKASRVAAYLTKPFQRWQLLDAVEATCVKPDADAWGNAY